MRRILACSLIVLASASVTAREARTGDADGGTCRGARPATARLVDRDPVLPAPVVKKNKPAPANAGGGGDDVRLQSPRWHRFLPGMFR